MKELKKDIRDDIPREIYQALNELGVPAHVLGYDYIAYAVQLVVEDLDMINLITKRLYPDVAKAFKTTPSRAERAIRHAVEMVFNLPGHEETLVKYFGSSILPTGKVPNSQFIASVARAVREEIIHTV